MSICDSLKKNTHMYLHTQSWFHCRVAPAVYQSAFFVPRVHRWMKPSYWWLFLGDSYEWKLVIFSRPSFISNGSFSFYFLYHGPSPSPLFFFFFFLSIFRLVVCDSFEDFVILLLLFRRLHQSDRTVQLFEKSDSYHRIHLHLRWNSNVVLFFFWLLLFKYLVTGYGQCSIGHPDFCWHSYTTYEGAFILLTRLLSGCNNVPKESVVLLTSLSSLVAAHPSFAENLSHLPNDLVSGKCSNGVSPFFKNRSRAPFIRFQHTASELIDNSAHGMKRLLFKQQQTKKVSR